MQKFWVFLNEQLPKRTFSWIYAMSMKSYITIGQILSKQENLSAEYLPINQGWPEAHASAGVVMHQTTPNRSQLCMQEFRRKTCNAYCSCTHATLLIFCSYNVFLRKLVQCCSLSPFLKLIKFVSNHKLKCINGNKLKCLILASFH